MPDQSAIRPVTVVVPVYGDIPSLVECVESLQRTVDQSVHRVLLMNDGGPEADEIESILLEMTENDPGFFYARNPINLGFVGNCNRAAFEVDTTDNDLLFLNSDTIATPGFLEELSQQLHESPHNGAVCARSNNATIASLPYKLRDPSAGRSISRTAEVFEALAQSLPPSSISPVAMGFCILIRRELVKRFGLFDEAFSPGYGEENDFCLRIGEHGYVSRIAHHALVFHVGSMSFVGSRRGSLRAAHEKLLVARYPRYHAAVQSYIHRDRDVVDVFSDALVPGDDISRVLIDVNEAHLGRIGAKDTALLAAAAGVMSDSVSITVSVPDKAFTRTSRRFPGLKLIRQSRLDGQWDLALVAESRLSELRLARLNRTCLRWVFAEDSVGSAVTGFEDARVDVREISGSAALLEVIENYGRSPVSLERLRVRWNSITQRPDYLTHAHVLRESRVTLLLRRAERIAPALVGRAKVLAKRVIRRGRDS